MEKEKRKKVWRIVSYIAIAVGGVVAGSVGTAAILKRSSSMASGEVIRLRGELKATQRQNSQLVKDLRRESFRLGIERGSQEAMLT